MDLEEIKKFLQTSDEGKAYIESLITEQTEGLKNKNQELLGKNKKFKEERDSALSKITDLEEQNEELEAAKVQKTSDVEAALEKQAKKHQKQVEELTGRLTGSETQIKKLLVDNGLNDALIKADVAKEHIPAVTALLKTTNNIEISSDDDTPVAMIGDKSLAEYVAEWSQGDMGKLYVSAQDNSGGGAQGSNSNASAADIANLSPMAKLQMARSQGNF